MKSFQEKSTIALEIVARVKLVNLQGKYNDEELVAAIIDIENVFVEHVGSTLTNQDYYQVFLDWLRANIKELITVKNNVGDVNVYLTADVVNGVVEVDLETFDDSEYQNVNEPAFYKALSEDDCAVKCIFYRGSDVFNKVSNEYTIS